MRIRTYVVLIFLAVGSQSSNTASAANPVSIRGKVTDKNGPLEGAYIGAHGDGKTFTTYVMTDNRGQFVFRGLAPGSYAVFTRIPGFRKLIKDRITVKKGKISQADFQVEPETEFMTLLNQASNSELLESLPLPRAQVNALDGRCSSRCHGASYYLNARFTEKDWLLIVSKMESITPVADMNPPIMRSQGEPPRRGSDTGTDKEIYSTSGGKGSIRDDAHIAEYLTKISGPDSREFPIKFQPRATGKLTRAVVTEYQVPRAGAYAHDVLLDPRGGFAWYNDWRANYVGSVTEFLIPTPWSLAYNAIGDGVNKVGWTVPHMSDRMVKADVKTGQVVEFPLPSRGYQIRNLDMEMTANPHAVWFINQRDGSIVRFQEYTEP